MSTTVGSPKANHSTPSYRCGHFIGVGRHREDAFSLHVRVAAEVRGVGGLHHFNGGRCLDRVGAGGVHLRRATKAATKIIYSDHLNVNP